MTNKKFNWLIASGIIAVIAIGLGIGLGLHFSKHKQNKHKEEIKTIYVTPEEKQKQEWAEADKQEQINTDILKHLESLGADAQTANDLLNDYINHKVSAEDLYKMTKFYSEKNVFEKFVELSNVIGIDYDVLKTLTPSRDGNVYTPNIGSQELAHKICEAFKATSQNNYMSDEYKTFQTAIIYFHSERNNNEKYEALQKAIDNAYN